MNAHERKVTRDAHYTRLAGHYVMHGTHRACLQRIEGADRAVICYTNKVRSVAVPTEFVVKASALRAA